MTFDISPDNALYLDQAVQDGIYESKSQALDQAVELLRKRDQLRTDVRVGIEQADRGELIPAERVFDRIERRAREIESVARTK